MIPYIIRELNENDYEEYLELINNFRVTFFSKKDFLEILNAIKNNSDIWVIEKDKKLIACGTILYEIKFIHNICKLAHIEDVCVSVLHRGQNYGKILMNHLVKECQKNNCYKVSLYCDANLEYFYKQIGFEKKNIEMNIYF
jgi:glucosamine-phosphate N-acetyltransferase